MRKVFKSHAEVCHVWASRTQDEGRAGNISFNKDIIFSYHWWPMARLLNNNIVLIVNWPYSSSTAKHINYVYRAIPDYYEKIYVVNPGKYQDEIPHNTNIEGFVEELKKYFDSFPLSRKYKSSILANSLKTISELQRYCDIFKLNIPDISGYNLDTEQFQKEAKDQEKHTKELNDIKEAKRQELIKSFQPEIEKRELDWINNKGDQTYFYHKLLKYGIGFSKLRLRVKDDNIETSQGAIVPLREAKILYNRIISGKDIKGFKIGYYTVISLNGTLNIGCHKIEREEITRIASLLNW